MIKFKRIREANKSYWLESTYRTRYVNDLVVNSFECTWQRLYTGENKHNNFYCSIAEWNTHITDMLSDTQFDKYDFETPRYNKALFRHYTRFLLIASEIITDFQDFIMFISGKKQKDVRKILSITDYNFQLPELFNYINNICKHKTGAKAGKYHCFNNHIDYYFRDSQKEAPENTLNIKNLSSYSTIGKVPIEVMELGSIIDQILKCYYELNYYLENNFNRISSKLSKYEI